jgi:hypothetical protein
MIDSCSGTGFVGPFLFLHILSDVNATTDLTVGSCDGQSAPIAPTGSSPTVSPVASPIGLPVSAPTKPPVAAPTKLPSEAPAAVATVTGSVSIRLTSTSLELEGSFAGTYLEVCEVFFLEQLPATNVSCALSARRLSIRNRSRPLRLLQSNVTLSPIVVATDETTMFGAGNEIGNYDQALIDAVELNSAEFALLLRTRGPPLSQVYFETVETVDAFSPTAVPAPSSSSTAEAPGVKPSNDPAPSGIRSTTGAPSADNGGLSIDLLFGGIAVGMACMAVIGYFVFRQRKVSRPPSGGPPSGERTPVHAMVSIVSSSYATAPMVSAIAIPASSVDHPPDVRHTEPMRDAVPIFAQVHTPGPLTYKDQAREHADAVGVPLAVAVARRSDAARSIKAEPPRHSAR